MEIHFTEIDAGEVKNGFPKFYDPKGRFFEIVHTNSFGQTHPIGFVGVRPLGPENEGGCELSTSELSTGELSVFVFRHYHNALTKGMVLAVLGLPQSLGFKRCWMATTLNTVVKLLSAMGRYGVKRVVSTPGKAVFVREWA